MASQDGNTTMAGQAGPKTTDQYGEAFETRKVIVDVRAWLEGGVVRFKHDWGFENGPSQGKGRIDVPEKAKDTPIRFNFTDDTGLGLQFYRVPTSAMWVTKSATCPTGPGDGGQFDLANADSDSDTLKVVDANTGDECIFKYSLRFDGRPSSDGQKQYPPYEYDPELRNGGGG